jgi:hypothetical protein
VQTIRLWIEGFLRGRYGFERDQAFRVLAVPVLIGAILVAGWLLIGPRLWTEGPMVRGNNVVVVACAKAPQHRGVCLVRDYRLPDWHQREARQERAD